MAERKKKRRGRPKAITESVRKALLMAPMAGKTLRATCESLGVNHSTVLRKAVEDRVFADDLARARVAGAHSREEEAVDAIRNAKTHEDIARARELAIHARWVASKLLPEYRPAPAGTIAVQNNVSVASAEVGALDADRRSILEIGRRIAYTLQQAADMAPRPYQPRLPATIDVSPASHGGDVIRPNTEASD